MVIGILKFLLIITHGLGLLKNNAFSFCEIGFGNDSTLTVFVFFKFIPGVEFLLETGNRCFLYFVFGITFQYFSNG